MLHVITETGTSGAVRGRNTHITKAAQESVRIHPTVFGSLVTNHGEVGTAIDGGETVLHIFAHGNQIQIGRFADTTDDSFSATDSLARLLRDDLRIFQKKGVTRIVLGSCYGGKHIAKLAPTIKHFVLPKYWKLTLEGANSAAYTDSAGNLRAAVDDESAHSFDEAIASGISAERYNSLMARYCRNVDEGLERVELVGEFNG